MAKIKRKVKKRLKKLGIFCLIILGGFLIFEAAQYYLVSSEDLIPDNQVKDYYNVSDFGFIRVTSEKDYNGNGIDDTTDILNGERKEVEANPKYVDKYYENGYPPAGEGVCTDLIWRSFKEAGYDLKSMISTDIRKITKNNAYKIGLIDDNIDFRRVVNQEIFFQRYAEELTTDYYELGEFMPGDILTFNNSEHIAMVSDKYNVKGIPYLIQNRDEKQKQKEEDRLEKTDMKLTGHYRFMYNDKVKKLLDKIQNT